LPRVDPAEGLSEPDLVTEIVGIGEVFAELHARTALEALHTGEERRLDRAEPTADLAIGLRPALRARPRGVGRPYAPERPRRARHRRGGGRTRGPAPWTEP